MISNYGKIVSPILLSIVLFFWASVNVQAEESYDFSGKKEEFAIYYRFDKIDVDPDYLDNAKSIARIRYYLNNAQHVDSITVYAWASPEGGYPHNKWLSEKRACAAKSLLLSLSKNGKLDEGKIKISPLAENWPGLTALVEQNYFRSNRDALLRILYTKGIGEETRKWRIKKLDSGVTWNYLKKNYMRRLRAATWVCVWGEALAVIPQDELVDTLRAPEEILKRSVTPQEQKVQGLLATVKTNILYDAVTALNIGVEFPLGESFSLGVNYLNPWWAWGPYDRKYAFQIQELGIEGRYYIAPRDAQRLSGWYAGIYGKTAQYDLQWDKSLCYQGEYWSVGATLGYVFPIRKYFRVELGLSLGYLSSDYRHYQPSLDYEHLFRDPYKVGKYTLWGPVGASATIILPIYSSHKRKY